VDVVVELVETVVEMVWLMRLELVLVLLPLLVMELVKQERSHKSSSHPSLTLVPGKVGAEIFGDRAEACSGMSSAYSRKGAQWALAHFLRDASCPSVLFLHQG